MTRTNGSFATRDLYQAAALIVAGHPLTTIEHEPGDAKVTFIFHSDNGLAATVTRYQIGQLEVDARLICDTVRGLKRAVFDAKGGRR